MRYWDHICSFHEAAREDFPHTEDGRRAVGYLRSVLEPVWKESPKLRHPLSSRLGWAGAGNYRWLQEYARKLCMARALAGFDNVHRRLGDPLEYPSAYTEVEVAVKLALAGLHVEFVTPSETPSPDLIVKYELARANVEVTSLNRPQEEARTNDAFSAIIDAGIGKAITGGYISRPPSSEELDHLADSVRSSVTKALDRREVVKVAIPGLALVYVAPKDLARAVPGEFRRRFRFVTPYPRSAEEQLARRLRSKTSVLFAEGSQGLLVIHTGILGHEEMLRLSEDGRNDIGTVVASYPALLGLVVSSPVLGTSLPDANSRQASGDRTFLVYRPAEGMWECSTIWRNVYGNQLDSGGLLAAFENYDQNRRLLPDFPDVV